MTTFEALLDADRSKFFFTIKSYADAFDIVFKKIKIKPEELEWMIDFDDEDLESIVEHITFLFIYEIIDAGFLPSFCEDKNLWIETDNKDNCHLFIENIHEEEEDMLKDYIDGLKKINIILHIV